MARKKSRPRPPEPAVEKPTPPRSSRVRVLAVLAGVAAYFVAFYGCEMPSLSGAADGAFRRGLLLTYLLLPDELAAGWFGSPPELAIADRLRVLAIAGTILAWAAAAGWLLMRLARADRGLSRLETFVFSTAVGLSAVSTYALLVGLCGLIRNRLVFAVPGVLTVAGAGAVYVLARAGRSRPNGHCLQASSGTRRAEPKGDQWLSVRWLWLAAPFALAIVLGGMLPPVEFDVREYHLQVPKEFYQQGYVGFLPHNVYGNMPMGTEMLSLAAMSLAGGWWLGALAGKTVIALFAPLTALALFAAGRRFFSVGAGVVAAVVYLSIPWIARVSSLGLVEGASACYLFLAVYAVLLGNGVRSPFPADETRPADVPGGKMLLTPFLLGGYLAGGAVACKYPALVFVVAPLALWILLSTLGRREASASGAARTGNLAWKPCGVFLLAAAVGCGAWLGKNWAYTGNPSYPLLYGVFGDRTDTWTPAKNAQWNRVHRPHDFSPSTLAADLARVGLRSEWLSPLVMPLAALAMLVRRRRRLVFGLAGYFALVVVAWWLLTHRIDRFWIPALPLVSLLAGAGADWSRDRLWRRALVGLLAFTAVSSFPTVTSVGAGYTRYFVSLDRLREDPERVDAWHRYLNEHAADGRVLVVGDAQVFDLEMPILYSTCFDDSKFEQWVEGRTPEQVRAAMAREGITHVFVHWGEIARYRRPGNYGFTDFVEPVVFQRLVAEGVLEPLPPMEDHPGRCYRVLGAAREGVRRVGRGKRPTRREASRGIEALTVMMRAWWAHVVGHVSNVSFGCGHVGNVPHVGTKGPRKGAKD